MFRKHFEFAIRNCKRRMKQSGERPIFRIICKSFFQDFQIHITIYIQIRKFPLFAIFSVFSLPNENRIILLWTHFTKKKSVINVWMGLGFNRTRKMRKQKNSLLGNKTENQELKHSCDLFGTKRRKKNGKAIWTLYEIVCLWEHIMCDIFRILFLFFCCLSYVMCGKLLFRRHKAQIAKNHSFKSRIYEMRKLNFRNSSIFNSNMGSFLMCEFLSDRIQTFKNEILL